MVAALAPGNLVQNLVKELELGVWVSAMGGNADEILRDHKMQHTSLTKIKLMLENVAQACCNPDLSITIGEQRPAHIGL